MGSSRRERAVFRGRLDGRLVAAVAIALAGALPQ
jgi:hypothetical protein